MSALAFGAPVVDIRAKGRLDSTTPIILAFPLVDLKARGKLDATAALAFGAPVVDLTDAVGLGLIAASVVLAFSITANLSGKGLLAALFALSFFLLPNLSDVMVVCGPFVGWHRTSFVS